MRGSNFFLHRCASVIFCPGGRTLCTDLTTKIKPKRPCTKVVAQRGGSFFYLPPFATRGEGVLDLQQTNDIKT